MILEEEGYDYFRKMYIENLKQQVFPWRPAYYYYCEHIDRIDIMSFTEFKQEINMQSLQAKDNFNEISLPIYQQLDLYYNPIIVMDKQNNPIKIV